MLVILSFTAPPLPPPPPKAFLILSFRPISAPLKPPGLSSPSPASPSPLASPLSWDLSPLIAARKSPPLAVTSVRRSANPETRCDAASATTAPLPSAGGPTGACQPRPCRPAAPGRQPASAPHRQRRYHPHRYWPGGATAPRPRRSPAERRPHRHHPPRRDRWARHPPPRRPPPRP